MKTPIWAKTEDGKWERFPFELLEALPGGYTGFNFCNDDVETNYMAKVFAFKKFRHYFEYNPIPNTASLNISYRLKKQPGLKG
jgi:hypothetical protein